MRKGIREGRANSDWERKKFCFEMKGLELKKIEKSTEEKEIGYRKIKVKQENAEKREGENKRLQIQVIDSTGETGGNSKIFKEGLRGEQKKMVARFKLESEMKERRYWEEEENRLCRLCGTEKETWDSVT